VRPRPFCDGVRGLLISGRLIAASRRRAVLQRGEAVPRSVPCDIQVLTLGDIRLAGIAGEIMVEIGLQIKARFPARLMLCGYANGVIGYIPTAAALRDGGYETNSFLHKPYAAPYAPAVERRLVNAVVNLLAFARGPRSSRPP